MGTLLVTAKGLILRDSGPEIGDALSWMQPQACSHGGGGAAVSCRRLPGSRDRNQPCGSC